MRHRHNALTVLAPALVIVGCLTAASPVFAQQTRPGETMGMRYLSWSGKAEAPTPPAVVDNGDGLRRPAGPPAPLSASDGRYPGVQTVGRPSRYGVGAGSSSGGGLTPASAWTGASRTMAPAPMPQQAAAPAPAPQSDPAAQAQAQAAYQAQVQAQYQTWYQAEAQAQYEAQVRAMPQPQQQAVRMQAPTPDQQAAQTSPQQSRPQYQQQADAGSPPGYDPMAPRRNAAIFHMQQPQADAQPTQAAETATGQTQASAQGEIQSPVLTQPVAGRTAGGQAYAGAEPPRESARYYSVHRAEGRQPDPIAMPASVYLDNAPVDLAEPPATPVRTRTVNGQAQVIVPNQDPNLP